MDNWRRCFALTGLPFFIVLSVYPASAAEFIQCRSGGAREGWKFDCTPWDGCEFTAKPQSDKRVYPEFFKGADGSEFFSVALGAKPTPTTSGKNPLMFYSFTEWASAWQASAPFGIAQALGNIDIDGRTLYAEKPPTGYLSEGKIQVQAPNQPIIDAMLHGKMLTANVRAKTGEQLIAMTYPLKGFADAVDAGRAAEASTAAKLQAGAECIKEYDPFGLAP